MHINVTNMEIVNLFEIYSYISSSTDIQELVSLSNDLSTHLQNKDILASDARQILSLIKSQIDIISGKNNGNNKAWNKRLTFLPEGTRPTSSISNQEGIVYISLLVLNILITGFMFVCLFVTRFGR